MRNREKVASVLRPVLGALVLAAVMAILTLVLSALPDISWPFSLLFLTSLYVMVPYLVSLYAVRLIKSLPVYILVAALPVILILVFPIPVYLKAIMFIVSGLLAAVRASARIREEEDFTQRPHAAWLALFVAAYLIGGGFKDSSLMMQICYYMAFAYALLLIIYMNFTRLNQYLDFNKEVESIPYDQISRTNYGTLSIYLLLTIALMVVLPLIGIDKLAANFGAAMKDLIAKLFNREINYAQEMEETATKETMFAMESPLGQLGSAETPAWLRAVYTVLTWIATILVFGGLLFALVAFAMRMMKAFYRTDKNSKDRNEFLRDIKDEKTFMTGRPSPVKRMQEWLDRSPNAQVRRIYKKQVLRHGKDAPSAYMTPEEAENFVGFPKGKERNTLHQMYEKARYSRDGCTREDVRLIKE